MLLGRVFADDLLYLLIHGKELFPTECDKFLRLAQTVGNLVDGQFVLLQLAGNGFKSLYGFFVFHIIRPLPNPPLYGREYIVLENENFVKGLVYLYYLLQLLPSLIEGLGERVQSVFLFHFSRFSHLRHHITIAKTCDEFGPRAERGGLGHYLAIHQSDAVSTP